MAAVGLLPDQVPPEGQGVWSPVFGKPAYTMTLAARLALQTGATVLLVRCEREPMGRGFVMYAEPLPQPLDADLETAVRQVNEAMEHVIRQCPSQYLWGYGRYKQPRAEAQRWRPRHDESAGRVVHGRAGPSAFAGVACAMGRRWAGVVCAGGATAQGALRNLAVLSEASVEQQHAVGAARELYRLFARPGWTASWLAVVCPQSVVEQRVKLQGAVHELDGDVPTIIFAPHFYGLDAGGLVLPLRTSRAFTSIFPPIPTRSWTPGSWRAASVWRRAHAQPRRRVKPIISNLRKGVALPTVRHGFRPPVRIDVCAVYGVPAATVPSLSRFARLGRAGGWHVHATDSRWLCGWLTPRGHYPPTMSRLTPPA